MPMSTGTTPAADTSSGASDRNRNRSGTPRQPTRVDLPYLRAWRLDHLLSQDELAEAAGIAKSTIVHLEAVRNPANLSTVGKLAKALRITRQQLVYEAPPAP